MVDTLSVDARSKLMSRVRGTNTAPEMTVRRALHAVGYRFRLHRRDLAGKPDIVMSRYRTAVFVHGCFWHGHSCKRRQMPQTNEEFWRQKISRNRERDDAATESLRQSGWRVMTIWQCELHTGLTELRSDLGCSREAARLAAT
jgi:DNA mismatch endonuclease, patch repair protein